jgi:hypothetical protein
MLFRRPSGMAGYVVDLAELVDIPGLASWDIRSRPPSTSSHDTPGQAGQALQD